ncbi:MAG: hypothetical protein J6R85_03160, partial [Lentisphaeria bacterium]|nr:hypothetical protein [Lentisphaeria bacterium]
APQIFDGASPLSAALLTPGKHTVTIRREGVGRVYANAHLEYYETADAIAPAGHDLQIRRRYHLLDPVSRRPLRELRDGEPLSPGTLVQTELTLEAKNDYHYLAIRDPRPAGMEPEERQSGYLSGGIYQEIRHRETRFYLQDLPGGTASLRYLLRVQLPGIFRIPPASAQALYAPELHGNSASGSFRVQLP